MTFPSEGDGVHRGGVLLRCPAGGWMLGKDFSRGLLVPLDPIILVLLHENGWELDELMRAMLLSYLLQLPCRSIISFDLETPAFLPRKTVVIVCVSVLSGGWNRTVTVTSSPAKKGNFSSSGMW